MLTYIIDILALLFYSSIQHPHVFIGNTIFLFSPVKHLPSLLWIVWLWHPWTFFFFVQLVWSIYETFFTPHAYV